MTGTLYTALALFMRDAGRQKGTYDEYVQKSIEYISSQYSYHITVEEIAQYAGVDVYKRQIDNRLKTKVKRNADDNH